MGTPDDLELLHALGDLADEITHSSWRSSGLTSHIKPDGSPVTPVDVEVERRIRERVLDAHPSDGFVSEELGVTAGTSDRCWFVDGLDGTRAYADGRTEWSTLIAVVDGGAVRTSLCTGPALGKRWFASSDGRALKTEGGSRPVPLQVSATTSRRSARVACWPPADRIDGLLPEHAADRLGELTAGRSTRPSWGSGVPNAAMLVAEGALDGFVLLGGGPWDHAATAAIVEAAGGAWSDTSGRPDLNSSAVVFTNGHLHDWLLAQLAQGGPGQVAGC